MYCQLQKNGFSVCFFHSNCMDERTSRQTDQAVSGALCCSRKKTSKGIRVCIPRPLSPSWAEKKIFLPLGKLADRSPNSVYPRTEPKLHGSARLCRRGLQDCALPEPARPPPPLALPLLSLPAAALDGKINGAATIQNQKILVCVFSLYDR